MLKVSCGFDGSPTGRADLVKGAGLRIDLGVDKNWKPEYQTPPKASKMGVVALLDTGAEQSFLDVGLAAELKLALYDEREVIGIHGAQPASWYIAQVHFPALRLNVRGKFAALHIIQGGMGYHALIGRTFLRYIRMEYNGVTGAVTIFRD